MSPVFIPGPPPAAARRPSGVAPPGTVKQRPLVEAAGAEPDALAAGVPPARLGAVAVAAVGAPRLHLPAGGLQLLVALALVAAQRDAQAPVRPSRQAPGADVVGDGARLLGVQ